MNTKDICIIMVVATCCVTAFMMLTANNPSADDFWRAIGSTGVGAGAAAGGSQLLKMYYARIKRTDSETSS